jgi:hypothetical protein
MATPDLRPSPKPVQCAAPKVYGYARVSTDRQADSGISLDEQERKIEARCNENDWRLEHVYVDAGVSGSTPLARRPEGGKLLAVLLPGDIVIAAKMDSSARRSTHWERSKASSAARSRCGCSTSAVTCRATGSPN